MEYSYFLSRLCHFALALVSEGQCKVVARRDATLDVQGAQLMRTQAPDPERRFFSPDFIFMGMTSELPQDPARAPYNCICIQDRPLPPGYTAERLTGNLIVVEMEPTDENLLLLQNHVAFILSEDFRLYRGLERIAAAERTGCSLRQAIRLAEELVVNPVLLVDMQGRVLCAPERFQLMNERLSREIATGCLSPVMLRELRDQDVYDALSAHYEANYRTLAWDFYQYLYVPVRVRGLKVAHLIVQNCCTPFHWSSIRLVEALTRLLSAILDRQMDDGTDRSLLHGLLLSELLRAAPEQEPVLRERVCELGWREEPGMQLLCCRAESPAKQEQAFAIVDALSGVRWVVEGDTLWLLCYPELRQADIPARLAEFGLQAGASWPLDSLMALPYARAQAETAFQMGSGTLRPYGAVFARHVQQMSPEELPHYVHPAAVKLLSDRGGEGELLETLEAYLAGPDQPNEVAAALHIHRSTLFYRLNRIREACGVELSTGEERMNLLLSLRLLAPNV